MIPFMAGILYSNTENGKDPSGSGLLYFWKLLHSSPPQLIPIHQMMFFLRYTESSFLSSQLQDCHKALIHSFKSWLIAWINFGKNQFYNYELDIFKILKKNRDFKDVMEMHSLTLQYVLVHPDIQSCAIAQLTQLKRKPHDNLYASNLFLHDNLYADDLFPCIYIFRKTPNILVHYFELLFRRGIYYICNEILMELTDQLDAVIKILISEADICEDSIDLLLKVVSVLNEKQAKYVFSILMSRLNCGNNKLYATLLVPIAVKFGGEYLEDAFNYLSEYSNIRNIFQYLINGLDNENNFFNGLCAKVLEKISMKLKGKHLNIALRCLSRRLYYSPYIAESFKNISMELNEEQLQYSFQCLIDELEDKNRFTHKKYAKMLVELSMKWNQVQLDYAFRCLMCELNDKDINVHKEYAELLVRLIKWSQVQFDYAFKCLMNRLNKNIHWKYTDFIKDILTKLKDTYLDIAFQNLMDGLNNNKQRIRKVCVDLLTAASMQWNKVQLDTFFVRLTMKGSKDRNKHVRYSCAKAIQKLLLQLDDIQINATFGYLISGFKDKNKNVQCLCAKSLGKIVEKLNRIQLNIAFQCVIKKLNDKNEDILVRMSSAESIGSIAVKLSQSQLNDALKCLVDGLNDEQENGFVRKYCAYSIKGLLMKLNEIDENTLSLRQPLETTLTIFKEKQFNDTFMLLFNKLKDPNCIGSNCVKELEELLCKLNEQQFNSAFKVWANGLKDKNGYVRYLCARVIDGIALKLNETQMDEVLEYLPFGLNNSLFLDFYRYRINETLENLNDKQLYLCTKYYSQIWKTDHRVIEILSRMSENMWQRVVMCVLKRDTPKKEKEKKKLIDKKYTQQNQLNENKEMNNLNDIQMEMLAFCLWIFTLRIQFNSNDKSLINSDAFNKLLQCCNAKAISWKFPIKQKWNVGDDIPYPHCDTSEYKDRCNVVCESARLGDMSQLVFALQRHRIDINEAFNKYGNPPLILAIHSKHWDIARYCIEQGAWIDVRGGAFDENTLQTPVECMVKKIGKEENKNNDNEQVYLETMNMCKWILKQRTIYPMKQIEYAIDYVKDKLIDEDGVSKVIDDTSATFLLGKNQKGLKGILMNKNLLYWGASRNVEFIKPENCKKQRFDKGWHPIPFLALRIFLLFEICVRLKRDGRSHPELPRNITFEQVYEKGVRELQ
ncbi:hypothetical protein RFI_40431, partial [Reticulomyxa filosa]